MLLVGGHGVKLQDDGIYIGTFIADTGGATLGQRSTLDGAVYGRSVHIEADVFMNYRPALDLFAELLVPVR